MNIIKRRIERTLASPSKSTAIGRKKGGPFRAARKPDAHKTHKVCLRLDDGLKTDLEALCRAVNVEQGVIIRDALRMYLDIAKSEEIAESGAATKLGPWGEKSARVLERTPAARVGLTGVRRENTHAPTKADARRLM